MNLPPSSRWEVLNEQSESIFDSELLELANGCIVERGEIDMTKPSLALVIVAFIGVSLLAISAVPPIKNTGNSPGAALPQAMRDSRRIFRGNIGSRSVEMRLLINADIVSGSYSYSAIGKPLSLKGRVNSDGSFKVREFDDSNKQTGTLSFQLNEKADEEPPVTLTGEWSRADGTNKQDLQLFEQCIEFTNGLRVISKVKQARRSHLTFAYPQLVGTNERVISGFNRKVLLIVSRSIREFEQEKEPRSDRTGFEADYNILIATNDLISIEITVESDLGGLYPNTDHYTATFDLNSGKEISLASLFRPGSNYKEALLRGAAKHAEEGIRENDRLNGRTPEQEGSVPSSQETIESWREFVDWRTWAISRRGIVIFFNLPHVGEALERNFIAYREITQLIDSKGTLGKLLLRSKSR